MNIKIYGIPNCDTIKKTMVWLKENKIDFQFHNYKTDGISKEKLADWSKRVGWETIFNKKSTTWRELPTAEQEKILNANTAIQLMINNSSIIKRPVVEKNGEIILVGFDKNKFAEKLL
ncbi:MAG: ArsC family reductase [Bacteroidota bacterium]